MNCKFCNNFIPDDAKVCSICGKNVEEEALVAVEAPETPAVAEAEKKAEKVYKKKSLKLPFMIIALAIVAFVALYTIGDGAAGCAQFKGWIADQTNPGTTAVSETDTEDEASDGITIDVGTATDETEKENADEGLMNSVLPAVAGNGAAGLIGVVGVALLGKRVSGNRKAKKQEAAK